jgi:uncharacterized membrane protein HdeD (DUF308 family)
MGMASGVVPRYWWALAVRGVAAVVFGILAFVWPGLTLGLLVLLFGVFALVNGVLAIISAVRSKGEQVWTLLLEGVVGILAGLAVFVWPGLTALVLLYFIAGWAILTGALEVASAIRLREVIDNEWSSLLGGVLSIVFGAILLAAPAAGALALVWIIAVYAVLYGITLFGLAWRVREIEEKEHGHPGGAGLQQPAAP